MDQGGRPTIYSEQLADSICVRLCDGESLNSICKDPNMPSRGTVYYWLLNEKHDGFFDKYTRAREIQARVLFDEMLDISDDGTNDYMERKNEEGELLGYKFIGEHVQRSRLRVDTRRIIAERIAPKVYMPRSAKEISGDGGGPIQFTQVERVIVDPEDPDA